MSQEWATKAARFIAETQPVFLVDDIWALGLPLPEGQTGRAIAGVMRHLQADGFARRISVSTQSARNGGTHANYYVSRVFAEPCDECDHSGVIFKVNDDAISGSFCACEMGQHPDVQALVTKAISGVGRVL